MIVLALSVAIYGIGLRDNTLLLFRQLEQFVSKLIMPGYCLKHNDA